MIRFPSFFLLLFIHLVPLAAQTDTARFSLPAIDTAESVDTATATDNYIETPTKPTKEQIEYENSDIKPHAFDENNRRALTKDLDYSVETEENKNKENKKNNTSWLTPEQAHALMELFKVLFWLIAAGLILFFVYQIAKSGRIIFSRSRKIAGNNDAAAIHIDEEDIQNNDFDALIRRATTQKNYVLAVRLYYMAILKELDLKGDIKWQKEKTNSRYLYEMKAHPLLMPFNNCTNLFDTYFYGQRLLDENVFTGVQTEFESLLKSVTVTKQL
jgi:hypothetical protein